jgi:hypothetical protein
MSYNSTPHKVRLLAQVEIVTPWFEHLCEAEAWLADKKAELDRTQEAPSYPQGIYSPGQPVVTTLMPPPST